MHHAAVLSFAFLLTTVPALAAQVDPADSVKAGAMVRVKVKEGDRTPSYTGVWSGSSGDSLRLDVKGQPRAFALGDVTQLERAVGKKGAGWKGAGWGAAIGGVILGTVALTTYEESAWIDPGVGATAAAGVVVGALGGAAIGGLIGALAGQTVWRRVQLPASVTRELSWRPILGPWGTGVRVGLRVEVGGRRS